MSERYTAIDWGYSTPAKEENWEEEFDKRFTFIGDPKNIVGFKQRFQMDILEDWEQRSLNRLNNLKSFISQLLSTHGKQIREETLREAEEVIKQYLVAYADKPVERIPYERILRTLRGKGE